MSGHIDHVVCTYMCCANGVYVPSTVYVCVGVWVCGCDCVWVWGTSPL